MIVFILSEIISLLVLFVSGKGVYDTFKYKETKPFTTIEGNVVQFVSYGIYRNNPEAFVAEGVGWDIVTVFIAIIALFVAFFNFQNNLKSKYILLGILAYYVYQFMAYSFCWYLNSFFLFYVFIYSASFFVIVKIITETSVDSLLLPFKSVSDFPSTLLAIVFIVMGVFLFLSWTKMFADTRFGERPPQTLGVNTLIIQSMDLGIIVPTCVFLGIFLLKESVVAQLISCIVLVKFLIMTCAILAMGVLVLVNGHPFDKGYLMFVLMLIFVSYLNYKVFSLI
eukprot:TRINITY_DN3325_c3_g2_i1.p1 TRINITY_DN3325_c3_g2~~TRINITY_DN3325_c3_g2_i1.p1  ORF type:complete len:281 (+),score=54.93 TRINITY_DN3325_c3_g2_i1:175-1017(+)